MALQLVRPTRVLIELTLGMCAGLGAADTAKTVLCTTFPIYQITRNVTHGRDAVSVSLLLPANLGCPHDYALTPQDMQKLARTDALIVNGLGLEDFLDAPVAKLNSRLVLIDSSVGIADVLAYNEDEEGDTEHADHARHEAGDRGREGSGKDGLRGTSGPRGVSADGSQKLHHKGTNPHLFASPRLAAMITRNIAAGLARIDPGSVTLYEKNAAEYASRLETLADEFAAAGKTLANPRIVQPHGVFDYLARDMGLDIVGVLQSQGQEPSAAALLRIAQIMREKKVGVILAEPQYPAKVSATLARETGVRVATLDPVATGPSNAGLDYYENTMRANLATLRKVLGVKQ